MEQKKPVVNLDYIAVLTEIDSHITYHRIDIEQENLELIATLYDMNNNPNCTVLDMQGLFTIEYTPSRIVRGKEIKAQTYDYCYPFSYRSSYIDMAKYPELFTSKSYLDKLKETKDIAKTQALEKIDSGKIKFSDPELEEKYIRGIVEDKVRIFSKRCKYEFQTTAERYIYAHNYYETLRLVRAEETNKMYSTENVGWTHFKYEVNADLKFEVRTNFGYGTSSYFFIKMIYQDVELLPYSYAVRYYYADMIDLVRYTRLYNPRERDSWNVALNFVADATNLAVDDIDSFIQRWIIDECDQMMKGLERIFADPDTVLKNMIKFRQNVPDCIYVRNISKIEEHLYAVYREELSIAFKVEKITGAILLIENLLALKQIYDRVLVYVSEIKNMAITLSPLIALTMDKIKKEIKLSENHIDNNKFQMEEIKLSYPSEFEEIFRIRRFMRYSIVHSNELTDFIDSHDYIKSEYEHFVELEDQIVSETESIRQRTRFVNKLETGQELIESLKNPDKE